MHQLVDVSKKPSLKKIWQRKTTFQLPLRECWFLPGAFGNLLGRSLRCSPVVTDRHENPTLSGKSNPSRSHSEAWNFASPVRVIERPHGKHEVTNQWKKRGKLSQNVQISPNLPMEKGIFYQFQNVHGYMIFFCLIWDLLSSKERKTRTSSPSWSSTWKLDSSWGNFSFLMCINLRAQHRWAQHTLCACGSIESILFPSQVYSTQRKRLKTLSTWLILLGILPKRQMRNVSFLCPFLLLDCAVVLFLCAVHQVSCSFSAKLSSLSNPMCVHNSSPSALTQIFWSVLLFAVPFQIPKPSDSMSILEYW